MEQIPMHVHVFLAIVGSPVRRTLMIAQVSRVRTVAPVWMELMDTRANAHLDSRAPPAQMSIHAQQTHVRAMEPAWIRVVDPILVHVWKIMKATLVR